MLRRFCAFRALRCLAVAADRPLADAPAAHDDRRPAVLLPGGGSGRVAVTTRGRPGPKRDLVLPAVRAGRVDGARVVVRLAARDSAQPGTDPRNASRAERLPAQLADVVHELGVRPPADDRHALALDVLAVQVRLAPGQLLVL